MTAAAMETCMAGILPIQVKRVYGPPRPEDGVRFLVDRLWPRGVKKEEAALEGWLKDVAPSDALRRWFQHDPARWEEFLVRYFTELDGRPAAWEAILRAARQGTVTLLFAARDVDRNNAVALRRFLEEKWKRLR